MRRLRQKRGGRFAALRATALQPAMTFDDGFDFRQVDLVIFPNHRARLIFCKRQATMATMRRAVIFNDIRRFGQAAGMAFVAGLGTAWARSFRPSWASEITSFTPVRPRRSRSLRKSDQKTSASLGQISSAIAHRHRKQRRRHGYPPVPLRSTYGQPWRRKQYCTTHQCGPLSGGRSLASYLQAAASRWKSVDISCTNSRYMLKKLL